MFIVKKKKKKKKKNKDKEENKYNPWFFYCIFFLQKHYNIAHTISYLALVGNYIMQNCKIGPPRFYA